MKPLVIAIEGVVAKTPIPEPFAGSGVNYEALWLLSQLTSQCVFVTGITDRVGVKHWMRVQGIQGPVEFPSEFASIKAMDMQRLLVLERVLVNYRGDAVVVDSSRRVRDALLNQGVTVLQPWWGSKRAILDEDDFTPLRRVTQFWDE